MKIPEFRNNQNLSLDTPNVAIDTQVAGQAGRSMQEMGKGFSALGEQFGKLRDHTESNTQKLILMKGLDDLENESMKDPDPFTAKDRVEAKAKQLLQTASQGIASPSAQAEFQAEAGLHMQTRLHSINTNLYRRQIDKGKATMLSLNDKMEQDYYAAPDEGTRTQLKTFMKENVQNAVKAGYVDSTEAFKYLDKTYSNMRVGQVEHDMTLNPSAVLAQLNKGKDGIYKDLTVPERDDLIKKTNAEILKQDEYEKRSKVETRLSTLSDIYSGKLDASKSEFVSQLAAQDPILAEAIQKAKQFEGEYIPEDLDNQSFSDLTKDVFNARSMEEISNYLVGVLKNQTGTISKDRMAILVSAAMQRAKGLKALETDPSKPQSPEQVSLDTGVKNIVNNGNKRLDKSNMITNFFNALGMGKKPEEAHTEAVQAEIKRVNPVSSKYKIGDVITNKLGEQAEVYAFDGNGTPLLKRVKKEKVNAE